MRPLNETVLNSVNIASQQISSAVDASYIIRCSVFGLFTGSPNGLLKIQASNDTAPYVGALPNNFIPTNWVDVQNANMFVDSPGEWLLPATELSYQYIRVVFTPVNSSSGSLTAKIKSVGI